MMLGDYRSLTLNVVNRLTSVTRLFPNSFNDKFCDQMMVRNRLLILETTFFIFKQLLAQNTVYKYIYIASAWRQNLLTVAVLVLGLKLKAIFESLIGLNIQWARKVFRPFLNVHSLFHCSHLLKSKIHFISHSCPLITPSWQKNWKWCFYSILSKGSEYLWPCDISVFLF